jgi:iron complex transport system ATP-binding protein
VSSGAASPELGNTASPELRNPELRNAPSPELLVAREIHARHPTSDRDALRDLTLGVARGEILALVGPNGSGKSTTLAVMADALRPRRGTVELDGTNVRRFGRRQLALRVSRLAQSPVCPEGLTAEQLVFCGRHPHRRPFGGPSTRDREAVRAALDAVDALAIREREVQTLSGGERRRVWLAMALCQEAEIMLLDEPTAALDLRHRHELLALLVRLRDRDRRTLVVVLHDLDEAATIADRVAIMQGGRLYDVGTPARCFVPRMLRVVFGVVADVGWVDGHIRVDVQHAVGR